MLEMLALSRPDGLALLSILTTLGLIAVAIANWRQRSFFGKPYFLLSHLAMVIWVGAVALEVMAVTPAGKLFWGNLAWPGIALLPLSWGFFIYHYAYNLPRRPHIRETLLFVLVPVFVTLAVMTNSWHGLFYDSITLQQATDGHIYLEYDHGPLFMLVAAGLYSVIAGTFGLLVWGAFRVVPQYRQYFVYPALTMLLIFVPNLSYLIFGFTVFGFDPTPFFFALVTLLFSLLIITNRVFDVVNVASELIFANLRSPALIIDSHGNISAANPAAKLIFPEVSLPGPCALSSLTNLAPALAISRGSVQAVPGRRIEASERFFDIDAIPIEKPLSQTMWPQTMWPQTMWPQPTRPQTTRPQSADSIGTVLLLNDVTVEEQRYRELEAELAKNMRQLETSTALQASLREAAEFDPLTRVRNRLSLPQVFEHCVQSAGREQRRVVLALFDIDHFKRWNDLHGHAAGDRVLRDFARFLEDQTQPMEPVFRIGGEEFLVMFPDASLKAAGDRVNAMRAALQAAGFQRPSDTHLLTFSAGLAQWPEDGATLEAVLESADRRLYAAKAAGRNRVNAA